MEEQNVPVYTIWVYSPDGVTIGKYEGVTFPLVTKEGSIEYRDQHGRKAILRVANCGYVSITEG